MLFAIGPTSPTWWFELRPKALAQPATDQGTQDPSAQTPTHRGGDDWRASANDFSDVGGSAAGRGDGSPEGDGFGSGADFANVEGRSPTLSAVDTSRLPPTHTVQAGDTLWTLSQRYYSSHWQWPRLWSFNPQVTNPHWIYPGNVLHLRPNTAGVAAVGLPTKPTPLPERSAKRRGGLGRIRHRDYGYLDRYALATAGTIVSSPQEHMLIAPTDTVYVKFKKSSDAVASTEYTIFRVIPKKEREAGESGVLVRVFGTLKLRRYDRGRDLAEAVITEGIDPIERGLLVARMPRSFADVVTVPNQVELKAKIVGTLYPQQMSSSHEVVFADVGSDNGVRPGNRLFVVRRSDPWRQDLMSDPQEYDAIPETPPALQEYPTDIVAEVRVLRVQKRTSTLLVTQTRADIKVGDELEMHRGY